MPAPEQPRNTSSTARYRVLLAIKGLGYGGAERLVADLVAAGTSSSFEYEVAYILDPPDALAATIASGGTPVHSLGATGNLDLRWMLAFRRLLVDGSFDIVHFHLPYTAALGRLVVATLPRRRRPVTVYTEHSLWNKVAVLVKMLNRATVRSDRALVAVSGAAYDSLPAALQSRARVVVHGVDLSRSAAMVERRRRDPPGGAGRARDPAGRRAGGHRGQPPVGEGLRRAARRGRPPGTTGGCRSDSPPPARGSQEAELDGPAPRSSGWATGSSSSATATTPSGC